MKRIKGFSDIEVKADGGKVILEQRDHDAQTDNVITVSHLGVDELCDAINQAADEAKEQE